MSIKHVSVASKTDLERSVLSYANEGYSVLQSGTQKTTLQKTKKFNIATLFLVFIPIIGWAALIIYVIMYAMKPTAEVIEIAVSPEIEGSTA